jgi:GR25 family glycosyltransferase involved in LPS biosynthesis/glycosyltransferase involved in cell wall biosynthesis
MTPSICLCMIVKNESKIIQRLLNSVIDLIDYYVICDTGSDDNTTQIIENFFKNKKDGFVFDEKFINFCYNRNVALQKCKGLSDYILLLDADMIIEVNSFNKNELVHDSYKLSQGSDNFYYDNTRIVKNNGMYSYTGVTHEYISCVQNETSGKILKSKLFIKDVGDGGSKIDKFQRDKKLLIQGIADEPDNVRYYFYLANTYRDIGETDNSIIYYKKRTELGGWYEEKYVSCINLYKLIKDESRFFWAMESFNYNPRRVEGILELIKHYTVKKNYQTAYNYYTFIKNYYENEYIPSDGDISSNLFSVILDYSFYLPYYMIIVFEHLKMFESGLLMYTVIFKRKSFVNDWYHNNLVHNLKFFKYSTDFETTYKNYLKAVNKHPKEKILFYTGFSDSQWNLTYALKNALGGSELAVLYLARELSKKYEVYISGDNIPETIGDLHFINRNSLNQLLHSTKFKSIIVSRYISFFTLHKSYNADNVILMVHDVELLNNVSGCNKTNQQILENVKIDYTVCLTKWHSNHIKTKYPYINTSHKIINNGINPKSFPVSDKIKNSFIYTSCSYRGLKRLLELWPTILEHLPDAVLNISSYLDFPKTEEDNVMEIVIKKYPTSIFHHGKLNHKNLYKLMSTSEYWLYPCSFCETSCITAMEMLMSGVICLYYPLAGLVDTIDNYGIQVEYGCEINRVLALTEQQKTDIRSLGKNYALSCSWEHKANQWCNLLESDEALIKIINLKRRTDRKNQMLIRLNGQNILDYEFIEAVDGMELSETENLRVLFKDNDFNYRRGVIGCALSHLNLWKQLLKSNKEFYIILEDDITFCSNFKNKLKKVIDMFVRNGLEHVLIGAQSIKSENKDNELYFKVPDFKLVAEGSFGYIISKTAAKKIIDHININGIKYAIDHPTIFLQNVHLLNEYIVHSNVYNTNGNIDTDIQNNKTCLDFSTKIAFSDWWNEEYCGGTFNKSNNFFTKLLSNTKTVLPEDNPDILFYSVFGNKYKNYTAKRKIFFSGEPYPARDDADYNLTFDITSNNNVRIPLWIFYLNKNDIRFAQRGLKNKFCSFIASTGTNTRKIFVEKLSEYKMVDCGGKFLNNVELVERGTNCNGKINFNNSYRFSIAFENTDYPGYVSEKILDVYKSGCIPIYWGTSKVVEDFNPSTFINCNDFENFDQVVQHVIKVDNDPELYSSYFKEPIFSKYWENIFNDPGKTFFKNVKDKIMNEI